jgi:phage N-6-adenine-methyltransferase
MVYKKKRRRDAGNINRRHNAESSGACRYIAKQAALCNMQGANMNESVEMGHNERTARLGLLADDARGALGRVASAEADTIEGWLAYGAALNEGRGLFGGDREFGQWVSALCFDNLSKQPNEHEQVSAMWAAANPDQFDAARQAGGARTVRGIYAKWQEMDAERKAAEQRAIAEAERLKAEAERKAAAEAKARAEAERAEARAKAEAEAAALRAVQRARDEEARRAAQERAAIAAKARAEAEARVKTQETKARVADIAARQSDRTAKTADKNAIRADKKAAQAKAGNIKNNDKVTHVSNNSGENEWYTPPTFIEAARAVMGGFDLDPASSEIANRTVKAELIFTQEIDGLKQDWPIGRIWMNPPYAQPLMGQFAEKFADEVRKGSQGVVLVNNATETAWFQTIAATCSAICFPKTRIRFLDPNGNPGAPLQGQAIIYCGPDRETFKEIFSGFGLVVFHG